VDLAAETMEEISRVTQHFSAKCPGDQTMRDTPVNREAAALVSHCREDTCLWSVSIPKQVLSC